VTVFLVSISISFLADKLMSKFCSTYLLCFHSVKDNNALCEQALRHNTSEET